MNTFTTISTKILLLAVQSSFELGQQVGKFVFYLGILILIIYLVRRYKKRNNN